MVIPVNANGIAVVTNGRTLNGIGMPVTPLVELGTHTYEHLQNETKIDLT